MVSKFKKVLAFILATLMCVIGVSCVDKDNTHNKEKVNINFENEEVEALVENVLNKSKEDFDKEEFQHDFNERLSSFMVMNLLIKEDNDVYNMENGDRLNKNEGMLNLFLMIYRDKENSDLQKADIEECLNNGNKDKEAEIDNYVKWYDKKAEYVRNIMSAYNDSSEYAENGQALITINSDRKITELSEEEQKAIYEKLKDIVNE